MGGYPNHFGPIPFVQLEWPFCITTHSGTWQWFSLTELLQITLDFSAAMNEGLTPPKATFNLWLDGTPRPIELIWWDTIEHKLIIEATHPAPPPATVQLEFLNQTPNLQCANGHWVAAWSREAYPPG